MKQIVCITLLFSMLLCLFSGCAASGAGATTPQQTTQPPAGTTAPAATTTPTTVPAEYATYPAVPDMINIAYEYPARRGVEGWDTMTAQQQALACQIPDETVKAMTTPALLETLYAYPRWKELHSKAVISSMTVALSIYNASRKLNVGQELQSRADLQEWIDILDPKQFASRSTMTNEDIEMADFCYAYIIVFLPYGNETPYDYPITPESPEWATMTTDEKIAACQIPEDILATMSTDALNTTLVNYPLLADAAKDANPAEALRQAIATCNGFQERGERPALNLILSNYIYDKLAAHTKSYQGLVMDILNAQTNAKQ